MNIPEVILCKFGEVVLKGANRQNFESALVKELRRRASPYGTFKIYFKQSTVYVEPQDEFCDMDGMYEAAKRVFAAALAERHKLVRDSLVAVVRPVAKSEFGAEFFAEALLAWSNEDKTKEELIPFLVYALEN